MISVEITRTLTNHADWPIISLKHLIPLKLMNDILKNILTFLIFFSYSLSYLQNP